MDKIVSVAITCTEGLGSMCSVAATTERGIVRKICNYFPDELTFCESDFIGLTVDEADALYHKCDIEYLQS